MPFGRGSIVNNSHSDYAGQWAGLGVIGTLGTSDIGGTALTLPFAIEPNTGAAYGIEVGTPIVQVIGGTIGSILGVGGTTIVSGTLSVNELSGTINVGTVNVAMGTLGAGTLQQVGTVGTNIGLGTLTGIGTITNIGSLTNGGTIKEITNIAGGTFNVGTVNTGTYSYSNFNAAGTTTLKTGVGILHTFNINAKSVGGVGTLFDSTTASGTVIAAIDTTLSDISFVYDAGFSNLTFAWAGNTGGNVTITYK